MMNRTCRRIVRNLLVFVTGVAGIAQVQQQPPKPFPFQQKLEYRIEWRLITAGTAQVEISPIGTNWQTKLNLQSAGIVNRLYRVNDQYRALTSNKFCGINSTLDAQEGKRHRFSTLTFDNGNHKLSFEERDLVRNQTSSTVIKDVVPCTHEILGALGALRMMRLEPGHSLNLPVTNGKKAVMARIEAQAKETVKIEDKAYQTTRYEAFLFDNVLYQRKGRLFVWITDDESRTPVQIRLRLAFPIGTITLTLEKEERG